MDRRCGGHHHRGEGGQSGSSEPALYPYPVQARRCSHAIIVQPDLVSRRRRNLVIAHAGARAISAMFARARLRGAVGRVRVERRKSDHAHRAWSRCCGTRGGRWRRHRLRGILGPHEYGALSATQGGLTMSRRQSVSRVRETARTDRKGDGETGSLSEHRAPDYQ